MYVCKYSICTVAHAYILFLYNTYVCVCIIIFDVHICEYICRHVKLIHLICRHNYFNFTLLHKHVQTLHGCTCAVLFLLS